jgi:hypothetical protein
MQSSSCGRNYSRNNKTHIAPLAPLQQNGERWYRIVNMKQYRNKLAKMKDSASKGPCWNQAMDEGVRTKNNTLMVHPMAQYASSNDAY